MNPHAIEIHYLWAHFPAEMEAVYNHNPIGGIEYVFSVMLQTLAQQN